MSLWTGLICVSLSATARTTSLSLSATARATRISATASTILYLSHHRQIGSHRSSYAAALALPSRPSSASSFPFFVQARTFNGVHAARNDAVFKLPEIAEKTAEERVPVPLFVLWVAVMGITMERGGGGEGRGV